jgi:SnoaL-like domain
VEEYWADDAEYHTPPDLPDQRIVKGRDAVVAFFRELADLAGQLHLNIAELRSCDGEVLVLGRLEVIGAASGADVWGDVGVLFLPEARKLKRVRAFFSWAEAREAAGLSE